MMDAKTLKGCSKDVHMTPQKFFDFAFVVGVLPQTELNESDGEVFRARLQPLFEQYFLNIGIGPEDNCFGKPQNVEPVSPTSLQALGHLHLIHPDQFKGPRQFDLLLTGLDFDSLSYLHGDPKQPAKKDR